MNLPKKLMTLSFAAMMLPTFAADNLPQGVPDFSTIKETDYLPALEKAIQQKRQEIQAIVANQQKPTFKNTILALEQSGLELDKWLNVFEGLTSAHKTPILAETEKQVTPLLTALENEISFNKALFQRIKFVYDKE